MEVSELDAKRAKAEEYLAAGNYDAARDVAEEIHAFAKSAKNRDLLEEIEYFNINVTEQERRSAKGRKPTAAVVASAEKPVPGVEVEEVPEVPAAKSKKGKAGKTEVPIGKGILKEKFRWTSSGSEFSLTEGFTTRDAAEEYCKEREKAGKKRYDDFKIVTVVRQKFAGQYCFNEKGETFAIYER